MNKPLAEMVSALVRTRPLVSIEEIRRDQNYPPVPPQAAVLADTLALDTVPLHVRQQRVRNGSRRKRDLAAVRMAEELSVLEVAARSGVTAADCWGQVVDALRDAIPDTTFRLWIEPITAIAGADDTLILSAPHHVAAWSERRYSHLICEALKGTGYSKVRFVSAGEGS